MASFTKGEIVLFPFPYTNLSNTKLRPCLVLSSQMNEDILLCQITSQQKRKDNYCVALGPHDTIGGTLHIASYIRCNMLFTASTNQIERSVCKVNADIYKRVIKVIEEIIR